MKRDGPASDQRTPYHARSPGPEYLNICERVVEIQLDDHLAGCKHTVADAVAKTQASCRNRHSYGPMWGYFPPNTPPRQCICPIKRYDRRTRLSWECSFSAAGSSLRYPDRPGRRAAQVSYERSRPRLVALRRGYREASFTFLADCRQRLIMGPCLARGVSLAVNSDADTALALVAHQIRIMKPRRTTANRAGHLLTTRP